MKNFLKNKVSKLYSNGTDFYELPYLLFDNVANWPTTVVPPFEESDQDQDEYDEMVEMLDDEPQDMENFEWLSVTDDELVVACGGDWQLPLEITMKVLNNNLVVTQVKEAVWRDGYAEDEFNEIIGL